MAKKPPVDDRYTYSAGCTWHGPIKSVGLKTKHGPHGVVKLPCCPYCGSMLFEVPNPVAWAESMAAHEKMGEDNKPHPNYVAFMNWLRDCGRCYPDHATAANAYNIGKPESEQFRG